MEDQTNVEGYEADLGAPGPRGARMAMLDVLGRLGRFETFLHLAEAAQVTEDLAAGRPLTVLAPVDAVFARLGRGYLDALLDAGAVEVLCNWVERHLVRGAVLLDQALELGRLSTVEGSTVAVCEADGAIWVGGARLERAPLAASNGVVYVLNAPVQAIEAPPSEDRPIRDAAGIARNGVTALLSLTPSTLQAVPNPLAASYKRARRELSRPG